jgi:ribonuclease HII
MIAGVDEAGRGPLAGPVVAAAVILDPNQSILGLKDSKKLTESRREFLFNEICTKALAYSIARADVFEIEQLNILQATLLAMRRAIVQLSLMPTAVYIDGQHCPQLPTHYKATAIVRGDSLVPAISAASILAKVTRDREMVALDQAYPGYEFAIHKGYPTTRHLDLLQSLGPCQIHRRLFRPINLLLQKGEA